MTGAEWWSRRRLRYNLAVGCAGLLAFLVSVSLIWTFQKRLPKDAEVTLFTIAIQTVGFLLLMIVANVCYFLGPLSERLFRPGNTLMYRERAYAFGLWFSVVLPFLVPAAILIAVIQRA